MKAALWLFAAFVTLGTQGWAADTGLDMQARYPTALTGGDVEKARPWDFVAGDIYHIESFKFSMEKAGLSAEMGEADVGIGHCTEGAVWALILPRAAATLASKEAGQPEQIKNLWLRFHPAKLSSLISPAAVLGGGNPDLLARMLRLALRRMNMSWQGNGDALIPEPKDMTVCAETEAGDMRFFMVDLEAQTAEYVPGFNAARDPQRAEKPSPPPAPKPPEEPVPAGPHPKIVSVFPADGATGVDRETDVIVTFDQPMDPMGAKLEWARSQSTIIAPLRYVPDKNQFVMRARFGAGGISFKLNEKFGPSIEGFCTPDGAYALPYAWQFTVQGDAGPAPAVLSISPPQGAAANLLTFVEIGFDQPMLSLEEIQPRIETKTEGPGVPSVKPEPVYLLNPLAHAENPSTFTLPILFPPKWSQEMTIKGFKSAKGVEAAPITLKYAVGDERFSGAFLTHMRQAAKDTGLIELLGKMKDARANIHSLNETIQQIYTQVLPSPMGESYKSAGLSVKWREPLYFAMDISRAMNCVFKMGNDDTTAWLACAPGPGVETCPTKEIQDKSLAVCDPFYLTTDDPATSIRNLNLEYLGPGECNGKRCHLVQRWHVDVNDFGKEKHVYGRRVLWFIDIETFLPVQVVTDASGGSRFTLTFVYDHVNEEFPVETFAPPTLAGLTLIPAPPLDKDYVKRFFRADDGSGGSIACRWGRQGPKGMYSSGMN